MRSQPSFCNGMDDNTPSTGLMKKKRRVGWECKMVKNFRHMFAGTYTVAPEEEGKSVTETITLLTKESYVYSMFQKRQSHSRLSSSN